MEIKKVGVVGCGIMGSGIAQICAQSGYQVLVSETSNDLLTKGLASISSFLLKGVERGKITGRDRQAALNRIKGTIDIGDFKGCDFVIEAASENLKIKKEIFAELDRVCPAYAILSTNTSAQSVIDIASVTRRPQQVLGLAGGLAQPGHRLHLRAGFDLQDRSGLRRPGKGVGPLERCLRLHGRVHQGRPPDHQRP